jgi:hypothetical protein
VTTQTRQQATAIAQKRVGRSVSDRINDRLDQRVKDQASMDEQVAERLLRNNFGRDQQAFRDQSGFQAQQAAIERQAQAAATDKSFNMAMQASKPQTLGLGQQGMQVGFSSTKPTGGGGSGRPRISFASGRGEDIRESASIARMPRQSSGDDYLERYLSGYRSAMGDY